MKTATDILTAAAELIERNGKAYGTLSIGHADTPMEQRAMCALGAIGFVASGMPHHPTHDAVALLRDSLGFPDGGEVYDVARIGRWSDENDAATVVAQLRHVAAELKRTTHESD